MTRGAYDGCHVQGKATEVLRILDRYLVEVVEAYGLCPWARSARTNGELAIEIVWGTPAPDAWIAAARRAMASEQTRVAMVVAPELAIEVGDLRGIRDAVARALGTAGVAEFHPDATLDLGTPARLVRFLRRSPDPLLQLVPLSLLQSVRGTPQSLDLAQQAQILQGLHVPAPKPEIGDRIADDNHATVTAHRDAVIAKLADIAADRARSYARAGLAAQALPLTTKM